MSTCQSTQKQNIQNTTTQKSHYPPVQVTNMLAASKNLIFTGHNHLLTTGADDPSLAGTRTITKVPEMSKSPERQWVKGHQYQWLANG